jgi:hypothetical protein
MATDKATTTDDLKTDADPEPTSTKSITLTSPSGTKVTASPDAAKKLKSQGWK